MEENQIPKTHNQKQEPQEEQPIFISTQTMVEQEEETDPLSSFKSLLEDNKSWYSTEDPLQLQNQNENTFSNLLFTNPFDISFDFGLDPLHNFASEFNPNAHLQATQLPEMDALETHESFSLDESKKKKKRRRKEDGVPAKNLMAERRRRQKLNDRLYMLRSVVPKISKMDRASILGDAVEYMKELLQKINDLNNELNSTPSSSSLHHPSPSTPPRLPCQVKEDFCPSSFPSSTIGVPPKVEVRVGQDQAFNIQMHCVRKPGLLLSTLRSLDCLGLDIHQAVISCFNGFSLDIFRAEQCDGRPPALPEQIKAVLLQSSVGSGGLF